MRCKRLRDEPELQQRPADAGLDLDPRYLRHDEAHDQVDFAHALFDATGTDDPYPPGRADCGSAGIRAASRP